MANFVPYSIPDVDRWIAIVAPDPKRYQTPSDSLIKVAQKVAFRWLEVREVVVEDFVEEIRIPVLVAAAVAARYFGFVSESRIVHRYRRIPLDIWSFSMDSSFLYHFSRTCLSLWKFSSCPIGCRLVAIPLAESLRHPLHCWWR